MNDAPPLIIANLKANKTWDEIKNWLNVVGTQTSEVPGTIIFCPPSPFLAAAAQQIKSQNLKIKLGSQDISRFENGPYTGEITAGQIADLVNYSIIGHSERRQNFSENNKILEAKVVNAQKVGIEPIFCIQGESTPIPQGVKVVAYEPVFAIGTGNPDTPENARSVAKNLKTKSDYIVIYGGSVTKANVKSFFQNEILEGVLVGGSSLNPDDFVQIIKAAAS